MTNKTNNVSELSAIIPKDTEVVIDGESYTLTKWTLGVDVWIEQKFGVNRQAFLSDLTTNRIGQLIYKLLKEEDKREFPARSVEAMDDDGNLAKTKITGWQSLLDKVDTGEEIEGLYRGVLTCLGASAALIQKAEGEAEKKLMGQTKKVPHKKSVGAKS